MLKAALLLVPVAAWVRVPGGQWAHESCMHEVQNGEVIDVPDCPYPTYPADEWAPNGDEMEPINAMDPKVQCYSEKAYSTSTDEFTQMNASFVVPPLPKHRGGTFFALWPGFKATKPIIGRPVLQPVLQTNGGNKWVLQSWGVGIPAGTMTGPKIDVSPGDLITSYIELSGDTWTVYGKNTRTGRESVLRLSKRQACNGCFYNNVVLINENVMKRDHCEYYPPNNGIEFTDIVLNGKADHKTQWQTSYDCGSPDCAQKVTQSSDGTKVRLAWRSSAPTPRVEEYV
jgi:hypothetical protein